MSFALKRALKLSFHIVVISSGVLFLTIYFQYRVAGLKYLHREDSAPSAPALSPTSENEVDDTKPAVTGDHQQQNTPLAPEDWTNFKNGLQAPLGEELASFKAHHPDAHCFDAFKGTWCEFAKPVKVCPSDLPCTSATYTFAQDKLSGFLANYDVDMFQRIETAVVQQLGEGKTTSQPESGPPLSAMTEWRTDVGAFQFIHFVGSDIYGNPVKNPYSIILEPTDKDPPKRTPPSTEAANNEGG